MAALSSTEPDQDVQLDEDGAPSIDLWRKGAPLGLHVTVRLAGAPDGTSVTATSRSHIAQAPQVAKRLHLNADAVEEFRAAFERLAAAERPAT